MFSPGKLLSLVPVFTFRSVFLTLGIIGYFYLLTFGYSFPPLIFTFACDSNYHFMKKFLSA